MDRKKIIIFSIIFILLFTCIKVQAFDVNNYKNKNLCGNFEVAGFHTDGVIDPVQCFSDYNSAKNFMKANGANDLALLTKVNGQTKIIDANMALVDLSVNPATLTYFYENSELTSRQYTYMDTGSLYGGVDGGLLDSSYSNAKGVWTLKIRTGNFTGWISQEAYEIVPITWLKSYSSYIVTNDNIRHQYVTKIQNDFKSSGSSTIGPKPEMLNVGTYYSFDGHYFYDNIEKLMKDYKNNNYNNSVNKDKPYYNYYMYLSNHTRTAYSSINIDEYIRNNLGIKKDTYGHIASEGTSRLYGSGNYIYYSQEKYGVNALLTLSLARNESGNGKSYLAVNKNNGFGHDAVDSNPINGAKGYPTFASSILTHASKWVTYGYAHPRDGRYFGPQYGDKWIGMNVKYASDTYWSEKMAANYYNMDKALGLQDYNYYQLGVLKNKANAYSDASTSSKFIYEYPEAEDAVVIVGEVKKNDGLWYKVVSDLNIDSNFNEITSGDYNWNAYVYVKADNIKKINQGKNGYISPNDVTQYQNKDYEYDLKIQDGLFKPSVGLSTKATPYYYDSSLQSKTGQTLLKDRYVMIHAAALLNNKPVSYLVTSDYFQDQKHWVSADSIKATNTRYGKVTVDTEDNQYTWVNYNTEDAAYSKISGLYTYTYVPILGETKVGNDLWYKVPVNLSGNDNKEGYTLSKFSNYIKIDVYNSTFTNNLPVITAKDITIIEGESFNPKNGVSATDAEDGNITSKIIVKENTVNTKKPGTYKVIYQVTDTANATTTKEIKVIVKENKAPVITASDVIHTLNMPFDAKKGVTAQDSEDGNLTSKIVIKENTVNIKVLGTYKVVYEVTDSKGKKTTKEIKVTVVKDRPPVIYAEDKIVFLGDEFDPYEDVTAQDPEDGNITKKVKLISGSVNTNKIGKYTLTYQVIDNSNNKVTKTITVEVLDLDSTISESIFYFEYLKEVNGKLELKGYNVIKGMNNTLNEDIEYILMLASTENEDEVYMLDMNRITDKKEMTRPVNSTDKFDYTYSWFKGTISTSDIPDGDYQMYILSVSEERKKIAGSIVSNKVLKQQSATFKDTKYITTRNNYFDESIPLELMIRSKKIGDKTAQSTYNQYNQYRTFEFANNKLHLKGTSYSYGMNLAANATIDRKIIFENTTTHEQYVYNLGSITNGLYEVGTTLGDKLNKTRAWFDASIDISNIPKGNYAIYISNKANISDYGELNELLQRDLSKVKIKLNNKNYSFKVNKDLRYRIELNVE